MILPWLPLPASKAARFETVGDDQWMYWVFLSNFAIAKVDVFRHGIMDVTWSVAIEEQFYLVWPALVFLFKRRTLAILCCAIIVVSPVARALAIWEFDVGYVSAYVLTPLRMDGLATGALVAMMVRSPAHLRYLTTPNAVALVLVGIAIFGAAALASGTADILGFYIQPIGLTGAAMLAAGCLIAALSTQPGSRYRGVMTSGWLRTLGKYSYCLYLIHLPIRAALRDLVIKPIDYPSYPGGILGGQLVFYVVALTVTLAIAWLSYHLYEKQFLKLKQYFPYK